MGLPVLVVPAFEPGSILPELIDELLRSPFPHLILVNDGSSKSADDIFAKIENHDRVTVLRHAVNLGKGAALKKAFNHVLLLFHNEIGVVTVDADGQHLVPDVLKVAHLLAENPEALIMGCRDFQKSVPFRSRLGNNLTKHIFHLLVGKNVTDTQTGLRGIPMAVLPQLLQIPANRYEFELDMLIQAARSMPILEVPIATVYIDGNKSSNFNPVLDSLRIYFVFIRSVLSSLATFSIDISIFTLVYTISSNILVSFIAGRCMGLLIQVYIAKNFVFRSAKHFREVFPRFLLLWLGLMGLSYCLVYSLVNLLGVNVYVTRICVDTLLFIFNFLIQRTVIFSNHGRLQMETKGTSTPPGRASR